MNINLDTRCWDAAFIGDSFERPLRFVRLIIAVLVLLNLFLGTVSGLAEEPVDFDTQIMPVLFRLGCSAAECHGASGGQGGLQLSLFGSEPARDFDQLVREQLGRRVHRVQPERSLLLLKATGHLEHGGGEVMPPGSRDYLLFQRWIAEGTRRLQLRRLTFLTIEPAEINFSAANQTQRFRVVAGFDDGLQQDVTTEAVVSLFDEEALVLQGDQLTSGRPGQHGVMIRYLDQVGVLSTLLPYARAVDREMPSRGFIDNAINRQLSELGLVPTQRADDVTLYRRLSLDLWGALPDYADAVAFAYSTSPDKYERLVDEMLQDQRFVDLWTWHMAEWLHVGGGNMSVEVAERYQLWIRDHVEQEASLAKMAAESLTVVGSSQQGATGFYRLASTPGQQAEIACNVWMGVRIGCAECHNHPLDHWQQGDYFSLASFFAGVRRGEEVQFVEASEVLNPVTSKPAQPRLPDGNWATQSDPRHDFADWLTGTDNPYFAASTANRIWAILMGRGLYEPIDDLRNTNPVSNRPLLDELAAFHRRSHFQLRPLIREIVLSEAYRRAIKLEASTERDRFYWRFLERELPATVTLNSITQIMAGEGAEPRDWLQEPRPNRIDDLILLGQCARDQNCVGGLGNGGATGGLAGNLELMTGPILNERIQADQGFLKQSMDAGMSDELILDRLYQAAYSRKPNSKEVQFWIGQFQAGSDAMQRVGIWEDIIWSILSSQEFRTNH